ncbi:MAG TPA: hypothetical protein VFU62_00125 [Hanamia sp.]|nr:hypothetical protein [Hanamia sp.]
MSIQNSEDVFIPANYPETVRELKTLKEEAAHISIYFKADIIISYLKTRSVNTEWLEANPELVKFMRNYSLGTKHIESLFDFYRIRVKSLESYENYIQNIFILI